MEYLVFSESKMEFRYGSGLTVYSEKLDKGRLICTDYHATGMPQRPVDRLSSSPVTAFNLEIDGKDATFGWSFVSYDKKTDEKGRPYASMVLKNDILFIELKIETFCGENGYFSRKMYLKNIGNKAVSITRVSPLQGVLWEENYEVTVPLKDGDLIPYKVGGFMDNWWGTEGNFNWRDIPFNTTVEFGSNCGRSGHSNPFSIVHNKVHGGYFVSQLEWSGNWRFRFFNDFRHLAADNKGEGYIRLCFDLAPDAKAPMRVVDPDETVKLPPVHFGYTYKDFDGAIQNLHDYQRKYILARSPLGYEPTYCAHWGFENWDMNPERLKIHIDRVAEMGFEMFLVDAGWYGKPGTHWFGTVGDWQDERIPGALKELVEYTHNKGMLFGLWIEPEAVGPDSAIRTEHPEWLLKRYGDIVERCLDLSKPEVEAWVEFQINDMIARYGIDLIRIDANNEFVCEGGFNEIGEYNENSHWRNVEAIHRIFDRVREKFPNLIYENCAGGGGRADLGMMSRFSRTQYSDYTRFPRVARTFNGMTMCLPPEALLTVGGSAMSCQRYGNIESQMQMMLQGSFYINPLAFADEPMNPTLSKRVKEYMDLYKGFIRPIQSQCKMYHHTPVVPGFAGRGWVVNEYTLPDGTKGYANLFRLPDEKENTWRFIPRGLDMSKNYKITFFDGGRTFCATGYELSQIGIYVTLDGPLTSQLLLFEAQ